MKRRILLLLLTTALTVSLCACGHRAESGEGQTRQSDKAVRLARGDWSPDAKKAVNDMLDAYGSRDKRRERDLYAVFDFDNTCSIFDIEEQMVIYQLETMAFGIRPEQMEELLLTGIQDADRDLTDLGYGKGSLRDWAADISSAYRKLWDTYGGFTPDGVDAATEKKLKEDPYWREFVVKIRVMYEVIDEAESSDISYPWMTYLFAGMTEEELCALSGRSLERYAGKKTSEQTWESPADLESRVGQVSFTWTSGVTVTDNIKELWRALDANGIDVWVCSASATGVIKGAVDHFGLHQYCKGLLAMTDKTDADGKYINEYDYETGCGYYATEDGWEKMDRPTRAQTQGEGKVTAIVNAISPEYGGRGPVAGFMDSTGDFNFCTEFDSLKLAVCFNRADRKVTEGGGLIAAAAMYEKDTLGYDLAKANKAGDTLYILQGRDETGLRTLRDSNKTVKLNGEEKLFRDEHNDALLQAMIDGKMSVRDALRKYAVKTPAAENGLGFDTGFLDEYRGYHAIADPQP